MRATEVAEGRCRRTGTRRARRARPHGRSTTSSAGRRDQRRYTAPSYELRVRRRPRTRCRGSTRSRHTRPPSANLTPGSNTARPAGKRRGATRVGGSAACDRGGGARDRAASSQAARQELAACRPGRSRSVRTSTGSSASEPARGGARSARSSCRSRLPAPCPCRPGGSWSRRRASALRPVERASITVPQLAHVKLASVSSGWIVAFIGRSPLRVAYTRKRGGEAGYSGPAPRVEELRRVGL